tara:strand:+ start:126656 stop:127156 length:501 start_codon:yes stop_codon:yes gene_type:complete
MKSSVTASTTKTDVAPSCWVEPALPRTVEGPEQSKMKLRMNQLRPITIAILLLIVCAIANHAGASSRPNVLIIMCDDLGYADVGFIGANDITTPALDGLANGGTVCTSAYVAHPVCGPSRAATMTGRYPHNFGEQFILPDHHEMGTPLSEVFLSQLLKDAGYFTLS